MKALRILFFSLIVTLFCLIVCQTSLSAVSADTKGTMPESFQGKTYYRVYFNNLDMAHKMVISLDVIESDYEKGYIVVEIDTPSDFKWLKTTGQRVEVIADPLADKIAAIREAARTQAEAIPSYPCYRTVEETFASAQAIATAYPTLATWTDQGDSWEKTNGFGGYDMMVLKLTNSAVAGPKPRIFMSGAIHAREYATAELVTRLAEYLVDNYGTDADATWMLDHHEVHLMLQANPDGRKYAESGYSWRKNTNQDYCSPTSTSRGADLNRNFEFKWDCCGGSSNYECDSTYHGAYAASEPEAQAMQNYMRSLFPDQRGPNDTDAAPLDATGVFLDIHAHGRLILWPWGWTPNAAPNAQGLQTFGRKMAYFNGHDPKQGYGLYPTDGTTKLFGYGELGIPAYTIEIGTTFFQSCSYFDSTLLPDNMPTLLYAIKVCRTPYMTPSGPDAVTPALDVGSDPAGIPAGTSVTLTASIDDTRYSTYRGIEPSQNVAGAEYYVDTPPWVTAPTPVAYAMSAVDGTFDATQEAADAVIDTTGLTEGQHIIYVRGQDAAGNWGAFSAVFLYINNTIDETPPTPDPMTWAVVPYATGADSVAMTATTAVDGSGVEYYFQCLTVGGHDSGWQDSSSYEDTGLTTGTPYTYQVKARDKSPQQNETGLSTAETATPDCPLPADPTALTVTASACDQIDLSWTDNASNETGFEIERSTDGSVFSPLDTVGAGVTLYSDATVAELTTYWYRVRATNSCGDSGYTNIDNDATPQCPLLPPAAPSDISTKRRRTNITLKWTDNAANEDGFRIYRGTSAANLVLVGTVGPNTLTYQDTGLTRKTWYYYKVCAYNSDGEGCSAILSARTK